MRVCKVKINGYKKSLYYIRNFGNVGDIVKVPIKDDIRYGVIEEVDCLDEADLGFSVELLREMTSITYEYDKKTYLKTKKEIEEALFNDYSLTICDYDLSDEEYNSYKESDIIECDYICSRFDIGKITKNTRFFIINKAIECNGGYYYVLDKTARNGKRFIFLVNVSDDYPRLEYIDPRCEKYEDIKIKCIEDSLKEENIKEELKEWKLHNLPGFIDGKYNKVSKKSEVIFKNNI